METTKMGKAKMGEQKGFNHWSNGLLGFVALENKECISHVKLPKLSNVALKSAKLSSGDAIIDESLKKKRKSH